MNLSSQDATQPSACLSSSDMHVIAPRSALQSDHLDCPIMKLLVSQLLNLHSEPYVGSRLLPLPLLHRLALTMVDTYGRPVLVGGITATARQGVLPGAHGNPTLAIYSMSIPLRLCCIVYMHSVVQRRPSRSCDTAAPHDRVSTSAEVGSELRRGFWWHCSAANTTGRAAGIVSFATR